MSDDDRYRPGSHVRKIDFSSGIKENPIRYAWVMCSMLLDHLEVVDQDKEHVGCRCPPGTSFFCEECGSYAALDAEMNSRQHAGFGFNTAYWSEEDFEMYEEELAKQVGIGIKLLIIRRKKEDPNFFIWSLRSRQHGS